ncbi:MAG: hypothetical protein II721_04825, partial [Bacilli bacterium]|nr:hypothetical protein [Bacilli bacterium]
NQEKSKSAANKKLFMDCLWSLALKGRMPAKEQYLAGKEGIGFGSAHFVLELMQYVSSLG